MELIRVHIHVKGLVQGVGFRYFTQKAAQKLHLTGWVRNNFNGDVEIQVQGNTTSIDRFLSNIRQGPPHSAVRELTFKEIPLSVESNSFFITSD